MVQKPLNIGDGTPPENDNPEKVGWKRRNNLPNPLDGNELPTPTDVILERMKRLIRSAKKIIPDQDDTRKPA